MEWWDLFRKQFPAAQQTVYLDNAYDCGGALFGRDAARRFFTDWEYAAIHNERGGPGRATLFRTMDETREMLTELIGGGSADRIAFTRNTNEGINAILQGFDFAEGDNIVTDGQEHESVLMPCLNAGVTRGIEVRIVPAREDGCVRIEELTALADGHTRLILVSHVQSATGYCLDLKRLGAWCRERGIFLVVDAIQSLGLLPFRAEEWQVDAVSAAAYKGLCAVNSTAFTWYHPELLKHVWPVFTAAGPYMDTERKDGAFSLVCKDETKARKMENSTVDALGVYVLHDALKEILNIGSEKIWQHIRVLYEEMYDGLLRLGYPIITPEAEGEHAGILSVKADHPREMFDYFRSRGICLSLSAGRFIRFSLGAFNNRGDIAKLLEAARDCPVR